jgi:hypothetical protein
MNIIFTLLKISTCRVCVQMRPTPTVHIFIKKYSSQGFFQGFFRAVKFRFKSSKSYIVPELNHGTKASKELVIFN